jgi:hypothetical protein
VAVVRRGPLSRGSGLPIDVYVRVDRSEVFSVEDAQHVLTVIDGLVTYLDVLVVPIDEVTQERHRQVFLRAGSLLASKLVSAEVNP